MRSWPVRPATGSSRRARPTSSSPPTAGGCVAFASPSVGGAALDRPGGRRRSVRCRASSIPTTAPPCCHCRRTRCSAGATSPPCAASGTATGEYAPVEARVAPFRNPGDRTLGLQYALRDVREREAATGRPSGGADARAGGCGCPAGRRRGQERPPAGGVPRAQHAHRGGGGAGRPPRAPSGPPRRRDPQDGRRPGVDRSGAAGDPDQPARLRTRHRRVRRGAPTALRPGDAGRRARLGPERVGSGRSRRPPPRRSSSSTRS